MSFTLGIDYGTNSVRALVVRCRNGKEFGRAVFNYTRGSLGDILFTTRPPADIMTPLRRRDGDQRLIFVSPVTTSIVQGAGSGRVIVPLPISTGIQR